MPTTETYPAAGVTTFASAQILFRRHLILRDEIGPYGVTDPPVTVPEQRALALRQALTIQTNNLPGLYINLFLYPNMGEGGVIYPARNNITWRPVFRMPPDLCAYVAGTLSGNWVPFVAPMLLPVGTPIAYYVCCVGTEEVSLEIVTPAVPPAGRERLIVSMAVNQ